MGNRCIVKSQLRGFFRPSRCPKETNSDRQVAVGDGRTAMVAGQAAAAADPAAARGRALVGIPFCLLHLLTYFTYFTYLLTRRKTVFGGK